MLLKTISLLTLVHRWRVTVIKDNIIFAIIILLILHCHAILYNRWCLVWSMLCVWLYWMLPFPWAPPSPPSCAAILRTVTWSPTPHHMMVTWSPIPCHRAQWCMSLIGVATWCVHILVVCSQWTRMCPYNTYSTIKLPLYNTQYVVPECSDCSIEIKLMLAVWSLSLSLPLSPVLCRRRK